MGNVFQNLLPPCPHFNLCLRFAPKLQRPGVEDVEVLKKELVQVQTLMDRMTREREEESECLKNHYEQLQANYTTSEVRRPEHLMC